MPSLLFFVLLLALSFVWSSTAKTVVVTVGGNTTDNPGAVFDPQLVTAEQGDVVLFNFTQGNHTAIQALFASPCIPAHDVDHATNGFNSGFRNAGNFSAITQLTVPITDPNMTIWFYDHNLCAVGGVGAINVNESSLETLDGFARNAIRLNGTEAIATTATIPRTSSTAGTSPTTTATTSSADRAVAFGAFSLALLALPIVLSL